MDAVHKGWGLVRGRYLDINQLVRDNKQARKETMRALKGRFRWWKLWLILSYEYDHLVLHYCTEVGVRVFFSV